MSAVFDITDNEGNILLWCQSDNAWAMIDYFKNIIDGKIPKTGNTTLHYYYAEDERKLFGNSFVGDISYEDLTIYYKKINDFLNTHLSSINTGLSTLHSPVLNSSEVPPAYTFPAGVISFQDILSVIISLIFLSIILPPLKLVLKLPYFHL